jgi:peptide/nickel transport system substrate-binding protein
VNDPVWRTLLRDVRFRRRASLAIDRPLINSVLYFGLATEGNNTVLAESPLYQEEYRTRWAKYDRKAAERLLDEIGLKKALDGSRRLPDGRPLEIIVETAGESTEQTDILGADPRDLARGRHPALQQAFAARIVPQPYLLGRDRDVGVDRVRKRIPNADMSPDMLRPDHPAAAAVAEVRAVLRDRRVGRPQARHPQAWSC